MKCRLCLNECQDNDGVPIFGSNEESNIPKLVAKHLLIEVSQMDRFSKMICKDCHQYLNEFHTFFQFIEQQQLILEKEILYVEENAELKLYSMESSNESMLNIKNVVNNKEYLDRSILSPLVIDSDAKDHFAKETDSEEDLPLKSLLSKPQDKIIKPIKKIGKRKYIKKKHKCDKDIKNEDEMKRHFLTPEENKFRDDLVSQYIELKCEICNICVNSYNDLRIHFRSIHKRKSFITCCGRRYIRRFLLWDHIQSHLNPDRFRCEICKKVLRSRASLKLHMSNMHVDRNQMKHSCHICEKKFPYASVLNSHMIVHKDGLNHKCDDCSKGFKTDYMLKMHIKHVHDKRTPFMCETCGKEYRFKLSFERHIAEHQQGKRNEPTEQCKICGKWLRFNCLRKHVQQHQNQTFECEICKRICKSKSALTSHIDYCHKLKPVHSCSLCDKKFKKISLLREHIAMHTGRKLYNCLHCPREFRSKANMYVHIKKMHVTEWTKAQLAKNQGPTNGNEAKKEI